MPNTPDSHVAGHKAARRTDKQIAQAKLDAAEAKLKKLDARITRLTRELSATKAQRGELVEDRDYRANHPTLREAPMEPEPEPEPSAEPEQGQAAEVKPPTAKGSAAAAKVGAVGIGGLE